MKPSVKEPKLRLQVFLSHNGVTSRRKAMAIIQEGRVCVNGMKNVEPSTPVNSRDKITVDGKEIKAKSYEYVLLNKPAGYVTTKAQFPGEKAIFELLPPRFRHISPVGRLDKDTEGLLLLTNDGDLAYKLTHPKFKVDKIYQVRIKGALTAEQKTQLETGIILDGRYKTAGAKIDQVKRVEQDTEFIIEIHEGKKRQIRLMCAAIGHKVIYLKRVQQGNLHLADLKTGEWRMLTAEEIKTL